MTDNICCSGGAEGSDTLWGNLALELGHATIHYVFKGHKSHPLIHGSCERVVLSEDQLQEADSHLSKANSILRRKWPVSNPYVANLLRRNYYQVRWSERLYAIVNFDNYGMIEGGTAWAVQMMINLHPGAPIFVFDQKIGQWYQWKGGWTPKSKPTKPEGVYAGIGTRKINDSGINAIMSLMKAEPEGSADKSMSI